MQRRGIHAVRGSIALTLLSLAECVTYIIASFLGDYLKDRLVYVNIASSGALAVICIVWPLIDVTYGVILAISLGIVTSLGNVMLSVAECVSRYHHIVRYHISRYCHICRYCLISRCCHICRYCHILEYCHISRYCNFSSYCNISRYC